MSSSEPRAPAVHNERRAVALALAAVALWSTVATGFKLGLERLEPLQLVLLATLVSLLVFWIAAARAGRLRLARAELGHAALLGCVNPFAYYVVLLEAYARLPAQVAQPLNYTWAIALAILAVPVLGQRLSRHAAAGIVLSYAGVVIVLTQGRLDALPHVSVTGVVLALASTLLWAGYWLAATRTRAEPAALMAWSFLFAAPLLAVACALGPGWPMLTRTNLAYGAWIGLVEMGVTFLLWQHALKRTRQAGRLSQLIFLSPFLSLVLIGTVLGERIHATSLVGLGVIVAGIFVARRSDRAQAASTPPPR